MRNNGLEVRHFEPGFTARNQFSENRGSTVVYDTVLTNIEGYDSNRVAETVFELIWPQQILTELCLGGNRFCWNENLGCACSSSSTKNLSTPLNGAGLLAISDACYAV